GLYGGRKTNNASLANWSLACLGNQTIKAVYGRGQRPYSLDVSTVQASDSLYEAISDAYLRATEVIVNEDLSIHPSIYGRFSDAIDVNTDIYQQPPPGYNPAVNFVAGYSRAMMFRTQTSDHR